MRVGYAELTTIYANLADRLGSNLMRYCTASSEGGTTTITRAWKTPSGCEEAVLRLCLCRIRIIAAPMSPLIPQCFCTVPCDTVELSLSLRGGE